MMLNSFAFVYNERFSTSFNNTKITQGFVGRLYIYCFVYTKATTISEFN